MNNHNQKKGKTNNFGGGNFFFRIVNFLVGVLVVACYYRFDSLTSNQHLVNFYVMIAPCCTINGPNWYPNLSQGASTTYQYS